VSPQSTTALVRIYSAQMIAAVRDVDAHPDAGEKQTLPRCACRRIQPCAQTAQACGRRATCYCRSHRVYPPFARCPHLQCSNWYLQCPNW